MIRGNRESRATRVAGGVPVLVGLASAMALTGAAFLTVQETACGDPGTYVRHSTHVELVGGCVDGSELPVHNGSDPGSSHGGGLSYSQP